MWPKTSLKKQQNNLGEPLNLLSELLEPWGVASYPNEAGLMHFESDVGAVQRALAERNAERVLEDYRGPLAPGVALTAAEEERTTLHEQVVDLLHAAALESSPVRVRQTRHCVT